MIADKFENSSPDSFNINRVLCLGSGYVGILSMLVLAYYHSDLRFSIYDKSKSVIEK
jgi:hypothetical protein